MSPFETQNTKASPDHAASGDPSAALLVLEKEDCDAQVGSDANLETELDLQPPLSTLPTQLDVCVPLPSFRVSDLIALEPGRVLASEWGSMEDLPLTCGQVQLLWAEFEVLDEKIAVRVTRLV